MEKPTKGINVGSSFEASYNEIRSKKKLSRNERLSLRKQERKTSIKSRHVEYMPD